MKRYTKSKFLINIVFSVAIMFAGAVQSATNLINASQGEECPAGQTETFVGLGYIFGGEFFSGSPLDTIESCNDASASASQIIRNHSTVTLQHILFAAPNLWGMETANTDNKMAASSDENSKLSFWGTTNLTQISEEQGTHFDTDIYQFTAGFDKAVGNIFFGSSLAYAHTEDEQGTTTSTSETVGFTPYAAYKINDYLFASGLAGYLYTHTNRVDGGNDQDTHDYLTEVNMNAFKVINSFILKARMGVRYKHTITSVDNGGARDNSFDELTWVGDGEIGYRLTDKLRAYTGLLYEYYDREASGASTRVRDSIAFMRYGTEYAVSNTLTVGAKIQHDINDEDSDYITGSINARLAF